MTFVSRGCDVRFRLTNQAFSKIAADQLSFRCLPVPTEPQGPAHCRVARFDDDALKINYLRFLAYPLHYLGRKRAIEPAGTKANPSKVGGAKLPV